MVLSSAAASTQTTILPTARTTLSMAAYKAIPKSFAKIHRRYLTPTVSTLVMGADLDRASTRRELHLGGNRLIGDAVTAIGLFIAFYYGLTGVLLRLVLPPEPDQQRPQPVDAGHPAGSSAA